MSRLHVGGLREWITIQAPTPVVDTIGGRTVTWSDVATVPAASVPLGVTERMQAAALQTEAITRFRVRVRSDLVTTMRVLWTPTWPAGMTEKTLAIRGVTPVEDGRAWVWLDCVEQPTT